MTVGTLNALRREGFSPATIAEVVLRPLFGENQQTARLERWHDFYGESVARGYDRDVAIRAADADRVAAYAVDGYPSIRTGRMSN